MSLLILILFSFLFFLVYIIFVNLVLFYFGMQMFSDLRAQILASQVSVLLCSKFIVHSASLLFGVSSLVELLSCRLWFRPLFILMLRLERT